MLHILNEIMSVFTITVSGALLYAAFLVPLNIVRHNDNEIKSTDIVIALSLLSLALSAWHSMVL